ncbi:hypothetical protein R1flu_001465 [Riccia fluitans]|uniref:Rubisco LSMT substrate-binding domain-containing protein n=1 Tax=Riccia fluitans TaxID=41844 RepID=A0ABD1Y3T5_9MARC
MLNNLELLEHYGFLLPRNPNDNVHIALPDSGEFGLSEVNPSLRVPGTACLEISGHPSFSLVAALRLRACHPSLLKAKGLLALSGEQIFVQSDILAYQWLEKKCKSLLGSLPTSLEDDFALQKTVNSVLSCSALEDLAVSLGESPTKAKEVLESFRPCTSVDEVGAAMDEENYGDRDKDFQLERWKLVLNWRIGYKQIFRRCIHFCSKKVLYLSR